jgi:hypothetical protein
MWQSSDRIPLTPSKKRRLLVAAERASVAVPALEAKKRFVNPGAPLNPVHSQTTCQMFATGTPVTDYGRTPLTGGDLERLALVYGGGGRASRD